MSAEGAERKRSGAKRGSEASREVSRGGADRGGGTGRGDPELDSLPIDAEGIWYALGAFRAATGERRKGAARLLGLAACRYFREHLRDPDLCEELEKALAEAAQDPDGEVAFAGRAGLEALRG